MKYFSDIELGEKERVSEEITEDIHKGIIAIYKKYASKNAFSESASMDFPDRSPGICGFSEKLFFDLVKAEILDIDYDSSSSLSIAYDSDKYIILDFIQFCYSLIKKATINTERRCENPINYEEIIIPSYVFDESDSEKEQFKDDINTLFRRNGLVFELQEDGEIIRKIPKGIEPLISPLYKTDDAELNKLIDEAFDNFLKVKIEERRVALAKIWDAFERMKTYYQEKNKKESISELIKEVSCENSVMIEILQTEAKSLTNIGNGRRENSSNTGLSIRHHETSKVNIDSNEHIDILFYRMVSFMQLFLKHLEKGR
jgi:hypothetical protein